MLVVSDIDMIAQEKERSRTRKISTLERFLRSVPCMAREKALEA